MSPLVIDDYKPTMDIFETIVSIDLRIYAYIYIYKYIVSVAQIGPRLSCGNLSLDWEGAITRQPENRSSHSEVPKNRKSL